jgi:cytosine/adenosine deaminase-related metal-dependent hydrolase
MHAIFGSERGRKHQESWDADLDGLEASPGLITSRQVLEWATLGGAKVAGIADRTGSLTPGKKADIVIIDGSAVNVAPIIDPVGAVVCAADVSNVKTVLVDGVALKEDFKLAASLGAPRTAVEASRDYLLGKFGDPDPGWLPVRATA